jgi:hypothetical protein
METLGDTRVKYSRRPYPYVSSRYTSRLSILHHANVEREELSMAQKEDKAETWIV